MAREIKFRGKSNIDGEWYFGSYVKTNDNTNNPFKTTAPKEYHNIVFYAAPDFLLGGWNKEPVIPQTVNQFTGLLDKNGKEIYEGDIIRSYDSENNPIIHSISWDNKKACYVATMLQHPLLGGPIDKNWIDEFEKEIIGNVFDNPELLKAETL